MDWCAWSVRRLDIMRLCFEFWIYSSTYVLSMGVRVGMVAESTTAFVSFGKDYPKEVMSAFQDGSTSKSYYYKVIFWSRQEECRIWRCCYGKRQFPCSMLTAMHAIERFGIGIVHTHIHQQTCNSSLHRHLSERRSHLWLLCLPSRVVARHSVPQTPRVGCGDAQISL